MKKTQPTPQIMGIVNCTPDSFSDGGKYNSTETANYHIEKLIKDGASIIDLGAESTRPGAKAISEEEERLRLAPIIEPYTYPTPLSIDTQKAAIADWVLKSGASIINDVSGLSDPNMAPVIAEHQATIIIMHMQGTPETMQNKPTYTNVIDTLCSFFDQKIRYAQKHGIQNIIIDPGIGFGKTVEDNLKILANCDELAQFNCPICIGTSNKSFIGHLTGSEIDQRLAGTIASNLFTLTRSASIFRVHDVKACQQAFTIWNQIKSHVN